MSTPKTNQKKINQIKHPSPKKIIDSQSLTEGRPIVLLLFNKDYRTLKQNHGIVQIATPNLRNPG